MASVGARRQQLHVPSAPGVPETGAPAVPDTGSRRSNLPSLTGWRFIAAIAVVANHLADVLRPGWPSYVEDYVQSAGRVGVTFFFMLSGFVLTWSSSARDGTASFYQRRVARIVPAYLVTWFIGLWLLVLEDAPPGVVEAVLGALLLQAWHPDPDIHFGGNSVAWSLSIEMLFYLVFPLVLAILLRLDTRRRLLAIGGLVGLSLGWAFVNAVAGNSATAWPVAILPVVRLPSFLCGILLALHLRAGGRAPLSTFHAAVLVTLTTVLLPLAPRAAQSEAIVLVPFMLLLLALASDDVRGRHGVMAGPVAVRLGQWSFALYLVHQLVFRVADLVVDLDDLDAVGSLLAVPVLTVAAVASAATLYRLVELPCERVIRRSGTSRDQRVTSAERT